MISLAILVSLFLTLVICIIFAVWFLAARKETGVAELLPRLCPLCGATLSPGENLLAERAGRAENGREKIVIKGCPRCLRR